MNSQPNKSFKNPIQPFASNFQSSIPFRAWFAILSLPDHSSSGLVDIILSGLEYLQLILQAILLNQVIFSSDPETTPRTISTVISLCQTLNPGYTLNFDESNKHTAIAVFFILVGYSVLKYGLFVYIITLTFKRSMGSKFVLRIWKWAFRLQAKYIYLFISSLWSSLFRAGYLNQLGLAPGFNAGIMIVSEAMIIIEFVFSFILVTQFTYSVPSKSFMSSKNQYTEAITLTQKFTVQFVRNLLTTDLRTLALIRNLIATSFCLIRDVYYLNSFPHYRLKATLYQSSLMLAITCINISYLMHLGLSTSYDKELSQAFGLVMSIILYILVLNLCHRYIKNLWLRLLLRDTSSKEDLLIHQILAMKEMVKFNTGSPGNYKRHSLSYLFSTATTIRIRSLLTEKYANTAVLNDTCSKDEVEKFIREHLQELATRYTSNHLIKLYLARYYAKKLKLYGQPMKILQELRNSSNYNIALSANILTYLIEESLKADYRNKRNKLDLYTYMENVSVLAHLKAEIFTQAEVQMKLYKCLTRSPQDLGKVFDLAQKVNQHRGKVANRIQSMVDTIPGYFLEPIMLSAYYNIVLNYSPHQYRFYTKMHNQRYKKHEKQFVNNNICQENLHHKYDHILVISGHRRDLSRVKYVSKSCTEKTLGKNIIDQPFCSVLPAHMKEQISPLVNRIFKLGSKTLFDEVKSSFQYNFPEEHFVPVDYYCNVNPFLNQGLSYIMVMRTNANPKEYVIIDDNGDITGFTKAIAEELGLYNFHKQLSAGSKINISLISSELARINDAFNMVLSPEKYPCEKTPSLSLDKANSLYSTFSTTGTELKIEINREKHKSISYIYHCQFEQRKFASLIVRAIALQRIQNIEASVKGNSYSIVHEEIDLGVADPLKEEEEEEDNEDEDSVPSENIKKAMSGQKDDLQKPKSSANHKVNSPNTPVLRTHTSSPQNLVNRNVNQDDIEPTNPSSSRKLLTARPIGQHVGLTKEISSHTLMLKQHETLNSKAQHSNKNDGTTLHVDETSGYESSQPDKRRDPSQVSKVFHKAIYSKYYPVSSKFTTLLLYLVFFSILLCQIIFKKGLADDTQALDVRKNVAKFCMNRTDIFTAVYAQTRTVWSFAVGQQNQSNYPITSQAPAIMARMKISLIQLTQVNNDMLVAMNSIDPYSREQLFQKNVRIYDTEPNGTQERSFINLTTFQAIDMIVESNSRGIALGNASLQDVIPDFEVVLINAMNDLLIESELIVVSLVNSVNDQKESILIRNVSNLAVSVSLLSFISIIYCVFAHTQYQNENRNMSAIAKLDINGVGAIMEKVEKLQKMLQDETRFDGLSGLDAFIYSKGKRVKSLYPFVKNKDSSMSQQATSKGIVIKYQRNLFGFFVLILIMTGLVLGRYFVTKTSLSTMSYVLNQIYFIDSSKPRIRLDSIISVDLLSENQTLLRNLPLLTEFEAEQYFHQNVTQNISNILRTRDLTYDPMIEGILFDNACDYVSNTASLINTCKTMRDNSTKAGLIRFLTDYQRTLTDFMAEYDKSNKTQEALSALALATYAARVPPMMVIADLLTSISNQLEENFEQKMTEARGSSALISGFIFFFLVAVCLLIHLRAVNRVKEADNQFRNVLKVFPAKLVLSNFILRLYLMRTWKETLDSAKLLSKN